MCGVCGIVSLSGLPLEAPTSSGPPGRRVAAMVGALVHRGPDEVGIETGRAAILGATRLAIRGLASGRQPIVDEETGVTVVCNGEIDNYGELREWLSCRGRAVRLATDVAVLPGLYLELGDAFVERLVGNFAIALWDPRGPRLLLVRDRAGERPLFYSVQGDRVSFATEIAALATDPDLDLAPDLRALGDYLRHGSFAAPGSPCASIRKLAPAEMIVFDRSGARRRRYWRWGVVETPKRPPSLEEFDRVFRGAVLRQTDVEVECGVFLSGGIDSSLVAAVARQVRPDRPLKAFTLRFGEPSFDEGSPAEVVTRFLGIGSTQVWVKAEMLPAGIAELVRLVGEPLADPAWVPTALLARRASQEVKVALVGEGADELFGGYPTYLGVGISRSYARLPRPLRALIRRAVDSWPPSDKKVSLSFLLKRFVAGAEMEGIARHLLWTSNLSPEMLRRLGRGEADEPVAVQGGPARDAAGRAGEAGVPLSAAGAPLPQPGALLDLVQRIDLETSLAEGLLTKADRASMQSALELRAPFLDLSVMEFAATLPPEERVRGITTKLFLKRFARRYLPREIVHRKKRGLSVPLAIWLRGPLRDWAESRVGDARLVRAGVDPRAALDLLQEHHLRKADHSRALWTLIVLDEWLRWVEERGTA